MLNYIMSYVVINDPTNPKGFRFGTIGESDIINNPFDENTVEMEPIQASKYYDLERKYNELERQNDYINTSYFKLLRDLSDYGYTEPQKKLDADRNRMEIMRHQYDTRIKLLTKEIQVLKNIIDDKIDFKKITDKYIDDKYYPLKCIHCKKMIDYTVPKYGYDRNEEVKKYDETVYVYSGVYYEDGSLDKGFSCCEFKIYINKDNKININKLIGDISQSLLCEECVTQNRKKIKYMFNNKLVDIDTEHLDCLIDFGSRMMLEMEQKEKPNFLNC